MVDRTDGLFCLPHKGVQSGHQIHPPEKVLEARTLTSCLTQRLLSEAPP